jgi:hypothetical protein
MIVLASIYILVALYYGVLGARELSTPEGQPRPTRRERVWAGVMVGGLWPVWMSGVAVEAVRMIWRRWFR